MTTDPLDPLMRGLGARLCKPRPLRKGTRRVRTHGPAPAAEFRHAIAANAHREMDGDSALFLIAAALGHGLGSGKLKPSDLRAIEVAAGRV